MSATATGVELCGWERTAEQGGRTAWGDRFRHRAPSSCSLVSARLGGDGAQLARRGSFLGTGWTMDIGIPASAGRSRVVGYSRVVGRGLLRNSCWHRVLGGLSWYAKCMKQSDNKPGETVTLTSKELGSWGAEMPQSWDVRHGSSFSCGARAEAGEQGTPL